ncbi:MAG: GGDEF domain-containing response regulator [Chloroflexi bacterium]|nr:GGDEF domain-containing response regulator [Chloroflexota bacterium]
MDDHIYKALFVEDSKNYAHTMMDSISGVGDISLNWKHVTRLDEAIELAKEEHFDIVLLDLTLPDTQGFQTFRTLHEQIPKIPIVVLTAFEDEGGGIQAVRSGAQDYLVKGDVNGMSLSRAICYAIVRHKDGEILKQLAMLDDLTGLYNRRGFFSLSQQTIKLAQRKKHPLLIMVVDLDGLKHINDTFGHLEGDHALIVTATILKDTFRTSDIVSRVGGDEFAMLAIQASGDDVHHITERIQKKVDAYNATNGRYELSISIGVTQFVPQSDIPLSDIQFKELLSEADRGLYEHKSNKRKLVHSDNNEHYSYL